MMLSPLFVLVAICLGTAFAQVLPFTVTGYLESASANAGTDVRRGGSVTISGFTIKIPDNLLVEFPALMVPFAEFTGGNRGVPFNEVSITGNIVGNDIIAGQMAISQLDLAAATGMVEALFPDGRIKIKNGPTLRINDPNAKYSKGYTAIPFFTADDENPSVASFSGVPMCVPRGAGDVDCPDSNRPTGLTSFPLPDYKHMVPIRVGDYLEYSGIQAGGETICYSIVVNIDITTSGAQPGFVRVEDALIGVADASVAVEAARYRFVGLASRSDLPITIWAIDQDPCTGEEKDRLIATGAVVPSARNKWVIDIPKLTNIGLYTRNYRIKIGDNVLTTSDGIDAGQYVQPVTEWIFPELVTPGGAPPPLDFSNIGPLRNGFGPVTPGGPVFKQLNPWPGAAAPTPIRTDCPDPAVGPSTPTTTPITGPVTLVADAGADQVARGGLFITLTAAQTAPNIPTTDLAFKWAQISGPTAGVTLTSLNTPTTGFASPLTAGVREFTVNITHVPSGSFAIDTVKVTSDTTSKDHPVINSLTWATRQSGTATASATTDLVDAAGSMRISFNGGAQQPMVRSSTANGKATYTFNQRNIPTFTTARVFSYINNVVVDAAGTANTGPVTPG
ncbi:hypothetical protein BGZ60DRAFT_530812 [Tricladium varicosporioides]|nr:hypothetical protein BGZ60DRAFT_530812 [Hymenoscyphus varicosporioides]